MDKKTRSVALRIFEIKEELELILGWSFDNDYVTLADQKRLIDVVGSLSNLDFLSDIKYSALVKQLED